MIESVLNPVLNRMRLRAIVVVTLVHTGVLAAVYGIATLPRPDGMELSHWLTLGGLLAIYGGIWLSIFYIVWPLISLVRTVQKVLRWRDWILTELPRIIALLPAVLEALRAFFTSLSKGGTVASAMSEAAKQASETPIHAAPGMTVVNPAGKPPGSAVSE